MKRIILGFLVGGLSAVACGSSSSNNGSANEPSNNNSDGGASVDGASAGDGSRGGPPPGSDNGPTGASCKALHAPATTTTASGAPVSVTIDTTTVTCGIAPDFAGTNYEAFPDWGSDISMDTFQKAAFTNAGVQMFRYPGGEPAEWSDLLMTGTCTDNSAANWGSPPYVSLWTFAQSAGLHSLMLQTNPTTQYCGAGAQDSSGAHAAAIASDAMSHGVNAVFEIGNEPDNGGSFFPNNGGQPAYIDKFIEQANAIHGANSSAEVYGPVVCGLGSNCSFPTTWDSGWIGAFLASTGDKATGTGKGSADGISFHVYWHPEWNYSDLAQAHIDKYGFAQYWASTAMPYLRTLVAKYDSRDLPIVISEISIGNGVASDTTQTQNMFTVLETLDTIGGFASSGLRSFQWFDANAAGPSDYWMITTTQARPIYFSFVLWSKMGDRIVDTTSNVNPHDVAVYATQNNAGATQVLLINKTNSAHDVTMTFQGANVEGKAMNVFAAVPTTAATDTSTSITYNGMADPSPSSLPAPTSSTAVATPIYSIAPYAAVVLTFEP